MTVENLKKASEGALLRFAMLLYELDHPRESVTKAFCEITGITQPTLNQAIAGRGSIGGENWLKIQKAIGRSLYESWLKAKNNP